MRVLAFASQKSGAGKTTLAGHMAVQAQKGGIGNVALIDVDPEASLADWCAQRGDQPVKYARATQADLLQKIENLRADGTELVVIDTPAALGQSIEAALVVADLIAIPARPCTHDLEAASAMVELVQLTGKPFVFVVNGATPGVRATITGSVYQGGRFRLDATPERAPDVPLHFAVAEPCSLRPGDSVMLAIDDGWVLPGPVAPWPQAPSGRGRPSSSSRRAMASRRASWMPAARKACAVCTT